MAANRLIQNQEARYSIRMGKEEENPHHCKKKKNGGGGGVPSLDCLKSSGEKKLLSKGLSSQEAMYSRLAQGGRGKIPSFPEGEERGGSIYKPD